MNSLRVWKIIGGLAALFALGGVCGAAYSARHTGWVNRVGATDKWSERWFMETADRLEVREDQMKTLRPMLNEMQVQLRDLQKETTARANTIIHQTGRRMWDVLDEKQRERYKALDRDQKLFRQAASESTQPAPASPAPAKP
jgi:hypothetical protein